MPFREAFRFWAKLGFINFGGPAGQIAIMHRELVEQKRWIGEEQFLRALNFCMILPGPEAQQLATYIGWRLHGILGGVIAGSFFIVPSIFVLLLLSYLAVAHAEVPAVAGLLYGLQPVVVAVVIEAVWRIGRKTIRHFSQILFAGAAFGAIHFLSIPFPLVIALAALFGILLEYFQAGIFNVSQKNPHGHSVFSPSDLEANNNAGGVSFRKQMKLLAIFIFLWAIPVGAIGLWRGSSDVLTDEALFFTKAAFVTFGGAYAVLSYIAKMAVEVFQWISAEQMVQGLALAESTPGPLIMVCQYVGFVGGWNRSGGEFHIALCGALITTYVTFLPSFMFIFFGAPYIELLSKNQKIQAAFSGVAAAVVGVILNLAVFFGGKVLFPSGDVLDPVALILASVFLVLLVRRKPPIHILVAGGALLGIGTRLFLR